MKAKEENEIKTPVTVKDNLKQFAKSLGLIQWIWRDIIPQDSKYYAKWMVFIHVIGTTFATAGPLLLALIIDNVPKEGTLGNKEIVIWAFAGFIALNIIHKFFEFGRRKLREYQLGANLKAIDRFITEMFLSKSIGQHLREKKHLSVASIEKGRVRMLNLQGIILFEAFDVVFRLLIAYIALLIILPYAAGIIALFAIPYLALSIYSNSKIEGIAHPIDDRYRTLFRYRSARWENGRKVKVAGMHQREVSDMDIRFDEILVDDRRFWSWFIVQITYRDLLMVGALGCVIWYGISLAFSPETEKVFTIGLLWPLIMWTTKIVESFWMIGNIEHQFNNNTPAVEALRKVVNLKPDITDKPNAITLPDGPMKVEFKNVWFRHKPSVLDDKQEQKEFPWILKNVSFVIEQGESVACIGASGCGKSTITMLLLRAVDPDKGQILVNGIDLRDVSLASWWKQIGYIPQRPAIFDGTISENIRYGSLEDDSEDVRLRMIIDALCIDFGDRLVKGFNTSVGHDGIELSGGEQQRVAAASEAYGSPNFAIIDEATASLDSSTEVQFQEGLEELLESQGATVLTIAHRLSTLRRCKKFIVPLPADKCDDSGSQVEACATSFVALHATSPTFRQLATDQDLKIAV